MKESCEMTDFVHLHTNALNLFRTPYTLINYEKESKVEDLYPLVFKDKGRWWLTPAGQQEVDVYLLMMSSPEKKRYFFDFSRCLGMFSLHPQYEKKVERRTTVNNWKEAQEMDCLGQYFRGKDFLQFFLEDKDDLTIGIHYDEDYLECIKKKFSLKEIARHYLDYLHRNKSPVSFEKIDYNVFTTDFANRSLSQMVEYSILLNQYEEVILPSDGLGVASCYCILQDIPYHSWEPNGIGSLAFSLGIINEGSFYKDYQGVYVYFYCSQYYVLPAFPGQKYICVDVPTVPCQGHRYNHCVFGNVPFRSEEWDTHMVPEGFDFKKVYCLDEMSRNYILNCGYQETKSVLDAYKIVFFNNSSLEMSLDVILSREVFEEKIQSKLAIRRNFKDQKYFEKRKRKEKDPEKKKKFEEKMKQKEEEYVDQLLEKMRSRVRLKIMHVLTKRYPYREKYNHYPGNIKVYNGFVERYYGRDQFKDECVMTPLNNRVGNVMVASDYILVQGTFRIVGGIPGLVRYIRLKDHDIPMFGAEVVRVYLISVHRFQDVTYSIYCWDKEVRPIAPLTEVVRSRVDEKLS